MSEPTHRISWVDAFAGMGIAFWVSNSLRFRVPDDYWTPISIACFIVAIGFQLYGRHAKRIEAAHDPRP